MNHLTDIQLGDAVEQQLDAGAATHLADCAACRVRLQELRAVLDEVVHLPATEPSPLFWEHFGARVNAAIDEAAGDRWSWLSARRVAWFAAAAVLLISVIGFYALRTGSSVPPALISHGEIATPESELPGSGIEPGLDEDAAWALVSSLADDLHYDDALAAGVEPAPGSVERAATELPEAERAELVRLIRNEMKRIGA
jgi:hypothetical protein